MDVYYIRRHIHVYMNPCIHTLCVCMRGCIHISNVSIESLLNDPHYPTNNPVLITMVDIRQINDSYNWPIPKQFVPEMSTYII